MNIFRFTELSDDIMCLSDEGFYKFLEVSLNKELSELVRFQTIRDMLSLSITTTDQLIEILSFDITKLKELRDSLGFVTVNGKFHLRLGHRNLLDCLFKLLKAKNDFSATKTQITNSCINDPISEKLLSMSTRISTSSGGASVPILFPWIKNIFENLEQSKNRYRYNELVVEFALLIFIFGGRNCYELLRLNLPASLPHITNLELFIRKQNFQMNEGEFRFDSLKLYTQSVDCDYVFVAEDATRSLSCIDYDVQNNAFIGFSSPLVNGLPQSKFFCTENFEVLKNWMNEIDLAKFINLYMVKSVKTSASPFILCAYGSNNQFKAIDVVKRWLYISKQSLAQGVNLVGFSSDADPRFLKAMRLCSGFFAEMPNLNLLKYKNPYNISISSQWRWFFLDKKQIFLFIQDPTHIATKIRNRLLSTKAKLRMGKYAVRMNYVADLIESINKIEHGLITSDLNPRDRQNFSSCLRLSSESVLALLSRNENAKGTFVYLTILRLIILGFMNKSLLIEERIYHIWTVVFICRLWFLWIHQSNQLSRSSSVRIGDNTVDIPQTSSNNKERLFITKPTFWCIEINAHTLIYITLLVIKKQLPVEALNTFGFNSQICESTFRTARSMNGSFSSITNFSVKSFIKRCEKISIVNSIKSRNDGTSNCNFQFPQHHKANKDTHEYSNNNIKELSLTENDIERIVHRAFEKAQQYVSFVEMSELLKSNNTYSLSDSSECIKTILNKSLSKITDNAEDSDSNFDSDEDDCDDDNSHSSPFEDEDQSLSGFFDEDDEQNIPSINLSNTSQQKFQGCRIYDKINPEQINKYFCIQIDSSMKYMHKQTACWSLTADKSRLSNDRLERVKEY